MSHPGQGGLLVNRPIFPFLGSSSTSGMSTAISGGSSSHSVPSWNGFTPLKRHSKNIVFISHKQINFPPFPGESEHSPEPPSLLSRSSTKGTPGTNPSVCQQGGARFGRVPWSGTARKNLHGVFFLSNQEQVFCQLLKYCQGFSQLWIRFIIVQRERCWNWGYFIFPRGSAL